jgi:hypothetical protein
MPFLKKSFFLVVFYPVFVSGQIRITNQDMPKIGDEISYSTSFTTVDYAETGANYTWDFSKLEPAAGNTMKFSSPIGAYVLFFLGSVAEETETPGQKLYEFYKGGNSGWIQLGIGATIAIAGLEIPLRYTNPDVIYKFPLNYNDTYSDTFGGSTTMQNITIAVHGRRTSTVDGWGKITTPYGTFDCIRVKSEVKEIDSLFMGYDNSRTEYTWLAKGMKIPVMQVIVPQNSGQPTYTYADSARNIGNVGMKPFVQASLKLYPNPAKESVLIELPYGSTERVAIEIYNTAGRQVYQKKLAGSQKKIQFDVSAFQGGLYLVKIYTDKDSFSGKLLVE